MASVFGIVCWGVLYDCGAGYLVHQRDKKQEENDREYFMGLCGLASGSWTRAFNHRDPGSYDI